MPESAVETVRRFMDAYVAGEYDRAAGELHAEAEWHNTRSFPGPTSGAPFDRRRAHACRVRDGKVLRIDTYGSFQRALDVLGLRSARV